MTTEPGLSAAFVIRAARLVARLVDDRWRGGVPPRAYGGAWSSMPIATQCAGVGQLASTVRSKLS